ncbi:MAG: hypothetical protein U9R57_02770 [Thermodesulfobacteriota bacterium]|nr:hypothetical protein [Thermodesulfobacteriota bacterium]
MRINMFVVLFISLAVFCSGFVLVKIPLAEQLSEEGRNLLKRIEKKSPSNMAEIPSPENVDNDVLLEKNADLIILQERNRMWLLIGIICSTPVILGMVLFCLKTLEHCSEDSLVNAIGLVLVIEGTMFIAVSAITSEQLTAPIGILGAIVGYLFGSSKRKAAEGSPSLPPDQ